MIKKLTLFALFVLIGTSVFAQDNTANFKLAFAFRPGDTLRKALPIGAVQNTNAFVYNPVVNEFWAASSHNDTIIRLSVPSGSYKGALTLHNVPGLGLARYVRQMTFKDEFFLWAVNNTDTVKKFNPVTGAEVARIVTPKWIGTHAQICWDSVNKGFWVAGASSGYKYRLMDSTLQIVKDSLTFIAGTDITEFPTNGMSFTNVLFDGTTPGGPFLWMLSSKHPDFPFLGLSTGQTMTMVQYSIPLRKRTGIQKAPIDDFEYLLNNNASPRAGFMCKMQGYAKPIMIFHTGKFTSNSSVLLPTDLSGLTCGYEVTSTWTPDASIDSLRVTPNFTMIPSQLARPVSMSAKTRNVLGFQNAVGNVRYDLLAPNGTVSQTQNVPFNLTSFGLQQTNSTTNFNRFQKGINRIIATSVVANDPVKRNDTATAVVQISDTTLARDYVDFIAPPTSRSGTAVCYCAGANTVFAEKPEIGQSYKLDWPVTISSVTARFWPQRSGDTTRFKVHTIGADGKPRYVGQTDLYLVTASDSAAQRLTLPLRTPVTIPANTEFLISMTEGVFNTGPYVLATKKGYQEGGVFVHSATAYNGWARVDTISNTFMRDLLSYALALRPNIQLRTATNDPSVFSGVAIAPNPTSGFVNLQVELSEAQDVQMKVMNISGQVVMAQRFDNVKLLNQDLDLSQQAAGVYLVHLMTEKGAIHRKIVKQ